MGPDGGLSRPKHLRFLLNDKEPRSLPMSHLLDLLPTLHTSVFLLFELLLICWALGKIRDRGGGCKMELVISKLLDFGLQDSETRFLSVVRAFESLPCVHHKTITSTDNGIYSPVNGNASNGPIFLPQFNSPATSVR